uniref:Putative kunitz-type serine protease inhibitor n=1 Tax=Amblyomma triste TaxID=251400 RepID=A0A023G9R0_AMBTT
MNFYFVVLVWCLNGVVFEDESGVVQAAESNSGPQRTSTDVCQLPPNYKGKHNGVITVERRVVYRKTDNKCVRFIVKKKGDTSGNNFLLRKDCYKTCIPKSACLKPRKGKQNGTIKGYTYLPKYDFCVKMRFGTKAEFGPEHNRFNTSDECQHWCAPEISL